MTVPTVKAPRAKAPELDAACAEAVDLARAAAEGRADVAGVGDHLGVVAEGAREQMELHVQAMHDYGLWATVREGGS